MKCKYINKHDLCVGCKNYDETGNLECISHELEQHSELFLFAEFWENNMLSRKVFSEINISYDKYWNVAFYKYDKIVSVTCGKKLIDVCEQALKYKEENETENN